MRGGIAERGGVRVGHRIIDINGQSVVTTSQKKMIHILSTAVGEVTSFTRISVESIFNAKGLTWQQLAKHTLLMQKCIYI
jgi:C-terminal processing protease CtpA/Prc